jgi:SAM-dependent methyltransferase
LDKIGLILNETPDKWLAGDAYEHFMGRWSRLVAKEFINWLNPPASWTWLEVGCGTGALTQAIFLNADPASVVACDPSPQFVSYARRSLADPAVRFLVVGADVLPSLENGFDAVVSGLVLNFIPAPAEAVRSMRNRLRPGGLLATYVWDYSEGMQFLRIFWEVAVELDSRAADLDERQRFPLCHPHALMNLLEGEGLERIDSHALEIATPFPDFDSFWAPFLGDTGPAPSYVGSLPPAGRDKLKLRLRQRLVPDADGPVQLTARAWAVRGYLGSDASGKRKSGT